MNKEYIIIEYCSFICYKFIKYYRAWCFPYTIHISVPCMNKLWLGSLIICERSKFPTNVIKHHPPIQCAVFIVENRHELCIRVRACVYGIAQQRDRYSVYSPGSTNRQKGISLVVVIQSGAIPSQAGKHNSHCCTTPTASLTHKHTRTFIHRYHTVGKALTQFV